MTYFVMEEGLCKYGHNVSMAVWQLRRDKFIVFLAREVYTLNLRSPGVTKDLKEKLASFRKVRSFSMDQVSDQSGLNAPRMV